jgi:hypothetical protein
MKNKNVCLPSSLPPTNHDELVVPPAMITKEQRQEEEKEEKKTEMIHSDFVHDNKLSHSEKIKEEQLVVPIAECRALSQHDLGLAFHAWCKLSQHS